MKELFQGKGVKPLYKVLTDLIVKDILAKGLKNGDFYCTLKSLCQELHASFITVRTAVALLEQQKILLCRSAVGIYIHDINKLKILNSFEKTVLILSNQPQAGMHPFYAARLISMMNVLIREGYSPRICNTNDLRRGDLKMQLSLADGVISSFRRYEMVCKAMPQDRPFPAVFFSVDSEKMDALSGQQSSFISYDNDSLFLSCMAYMGGQASRNIVFVHKSQTVLPEILQKEPGLNVTELIYRTFPSVESGVDIAAKIPSCPENAFFLVDDDYVAIGMHETALVDGVNLIREKRILAIASPVFGITAQMGFPVIGFDPNEIGTVAAEMLVQMIRTPRKTFCRFITARGNGNAT